MFQPNPPTPRAMPDAELNAQIAQLQLQPDGLIAAMALIEEQSRLRQEDALELSKWELASQMHAATAPAVGVPELQDPAFPAAQAVELTADPIPAAPQDPAPQEPEIDIFANVPAEPVASVKSPIVPAAENLDDIVAALNQSYAAAATESEPSAPEVNSPQEPELNLKEQAPEPNNAEVNLENAAPAPLEQEFIEENEADDQATGITGTAAAHSWSWLALAASPLALVLAAVLKESGASLAQSFILLAVALFTTSVLAAVGSMSAARASSSLTVVSRAAFGVWGNAFPAAVMLLIKLLWSAALIYFATRVISPLIFNQPWFASFSEALAFPAEFTASLFVIGPVLIVSAVAAGLGGIVMLRLQQLTAVLSVVSIGAFAFFVASTYSLLDLERGEAIAQTSFIDLGLLLVSIFGLTVFSMSGDFARKLPSSTPGAKVFFLTFISTFFLPLISGVVGLMWLFMAGDTLGSSFLTEVLATAATAAPIWVFMVFVVALGLSIVQLVSASLYSLYGSMIGLVRIPSGAAQAAMLVAVLTTVLVPSYLVAVSVLQESILELILLAGVVAAAWVGIVVSDALARTRGYHEVSLTREYGFYGRVNAANSIGFALAIALGFGYLNGGNQLSSWTGYLGNLTPEIFEIAGSNIGIAMAFGFAALFPVLFGIPRIRKQEQNLSELDQRREELKEFLDSAS
jgi:nucleobase:cation symporter-1, NCS1 family